MEEELEELKKEIRELERICDVKDSEIRRLHDVIRCMKENKNYEKP